MAKTTTMTKWIYKDKEVEELPELCEAFVYIITNTTNNKKYVGKKLAKFRVTRPPLKGKKRKRKSFKESDWRTYWGSSEHLKNDVQELGEDKFIREILYYCPSKGSAGYLEAREQFERNVLASDDYYNGIINVRIGQSDNLQEALRMIDEISS